MFPVLYEEADGENLLFCHEYTIHVDAPHYYIGVYTGKYENENQTILSFKQMKSVFVGRGVVAMYSPQYFVSTRKYKRIVYETEQKRAYRAFFERRAVNQIVGEILGHPGNYY
jgi:hypothetical protein